MYFFAFRNGMCVNAKGATIKVILPPSFLYISPNMGRTRARFKN